MRASFWMMLLMLLLLPIGGTAMAQTSVGNLQIDCATGYQVFVDGKLAGVCATNHEGFLVSNLPAGDHVIGVRKSGYVPGRFAVSIQPGTTAELKVADLKLRRRIKFRPKEEPVDMTVESPPMVSDDTGTPGDRNVELNFTFDGSLSHDLNRWEAPLIDFNYGVGENLQLKYEVPWVVQHSTELDDNGSEHRVSAHGLGDSTLGVKYRFYDNDDTNLSFAVYPQVELRTPGSRKEEDGGVASGATTWILPILLTKEFEKVAVTANAGVERSTDEGSALFASAGLGTRLSAQTAILGEIAGEDLGHSDSRRIRIDLGIRRKIDDHQTVGASIGRDVEAGAGDKQTYVLVSYQHFFGE